MTQGFTRWPSTTKPLDREQLQADVREIADAQRAASDALQRLATAYGNLSLHHHLDAEGAMRLYAGQAYEIRSLLLCNEAQVDEKEFGGRFYRHFSQPKVR